MNTILKSRCHNGFARVLSAFVPNSPTVLMYDMPHVLYVMYALYHICYGINQGNVLRNVYPSVSTHNMIPLHSCQC